jgi:hypothetical protein
MVFSSGILFFSILWYTIRDERAYATPRDIIAILRDLAIQ